MEDFMGKPSMHVGFTIAMFDHWGVGQNAECSVLRFLLPFVRGSFCVVPSPKINTSQKPWDSVPFLFCF